MHPPKSIVPQLCKHNKDESFNSLHDIMHRVQSSIMALTNVTMTLYRAEVHNYTHTSLYSILQTSCTFLPKVMIM